MSHPEPVLVVAGGSSGIGNALVRLTESHGIPVVNLDRQEPPPGTPGCYMNVNLSDGLALKDVANQLEQKGSGIRGLAVVAGKGFTTPFQETSWDEWSHQIDENLGLAFRVCSQFASRLTSAGSIVVLASTAAFGGPGASVAYSAAKAGILGLSGSLARELAPKGIRVNAVVPGPTDTPLFQSLSTPSERQLLVRLTPLQRLAEAMDIAEAIFFLLSPRARHITGQAITVDGGLTLAFRPAL